MIDDLDEALRELLIREMPINDNEVEISFDQPTRDWASRLSRPTINIFMLDIRENNKLRTQHPYFGVDSNGGSATISQGAVRVDIHYMVTAWANDPSDEHRILGRLLMVLYRYRALPDDLNMGQLPVDDYEIIMRVAQHDQRDRRKDEIWSMLDNELRPVIDLACTIAIEPFEAWTVPLVTETEVSFGQFAPIRSGESLGMVSEGAVAQDQFYTVSGMVYGADAYDHFGVELLELAVPVTISPGGRYLIQNLRPGTYTVEVWTGEEEPVRQVIEVPSPSSEYDIHL